MANKHHGIYEKLYEKYVIDGDKPFYIGIWTYAGHTFKLTSSLIHGMSVWRIDVRTMTGKWTFETGNLIFENTQACYTVADVSINIKHAFKCGIDIASEYIQTVYDTTNQN